MDNEALTKIESMLKVMERDLKEMNRHFEVNMGLIRDAIDGERRKVSPSRFPDDAPMAKTSIKETGADSPAAEPVKEDMLYGALAMEAARSSLLGNVYKSRMEELSDAPEVQPSSLEPIEGVAGVYSGDKEKADVAAGMAKKAVSVKKKPEPFTKDMEKWIGKNVMGIIASVLVFMSLGVFGAVIFPLLGDEIRFALMMAFSLLLLSFGILRYEKSPSVFSISLSSCGIGAVYVTLLVGRVLFGLFNDIALYGFLFVWSVAVFFLMKRYASVVFNVIGYLGALVSVFLASRSISDDFDPKMVLFLSVYTVIVLMLYSVRAKGFPDYIVSTAVTAICASRVVSLYISHDRLLPPGELSYADGRFLWHDDIFLILSFLVMVFLLVFKVYVNHVSDRGDVPLKVSYPTSFFSLLPVMGVFGGSDTFMVGFIPLVLAFLIYFLINGKDHGAESRSLSITFNLLTIAVAYIYMHSISFNGALFGIEGTVLDSDMVFDSLGAFWIAFPVIICAMLNKRNRTEALVVSVAVPVINMAYYTGGRYSYVPWEMPDGGSCASFLILFLAGILYTCLMYRYVYGGDARCPVLVKAFTYADALLLSMAAGLAMTSFLDGRGLYSRDIGLCATFLVAFAVNFLARGLVKCREMKLVFIILTSLSSLSGIVALFGGAENGSADSYVKVLSLISYVFLAILISLMVSLPLSDIRSMSVTVYSLYIAIGYTLFIISVTGGLENAYIVSVSFIIWAVFCIFMGFMMKVRHTRIYGLVLSIIGVLKLVLFDLSYTNTVWKAVSLMVCGILLFIVSYIYNRAEKKYKA